MHSSLTNRFVLAASIAVALIVQVASAAPPRLMSTVTPLQPSAFGGRGSGLGRQFGPGGGFGGGVREDVPVVDQFDKDGDHRLNAEERRAALDYVESMGLNRGRGGPRPGGATDGEPGPKISPASVQTFADTVPLYDSATLRTFFLDFEGADWERQLMAFKRTDVRVPATLRVDGKTYRDVGVQFHGNSSFSSVPQGLKHSMTLEIDFAHGDQRLGGYRTLTLLNSHEDPSYVHAVLYLQAARTYLPASKANFVRLVLNGESWGIHPNVEHFNKDFTSEWFPTGADARWKVPGSPGARAGLEYLGEDPSPYKRTYEIKTKDDPKSWAALVNLTRVLNETPADRLEAGLAPILDIDETLKFLAIDNALVNNDGYWVRSSDYSIYLDTSGRFHVLPYDVNETWPTGVARGGGRGPMGGDAGLDPLSGLSDPTKPLRSKLLAVPALRAKYLSDVRDITTKWLDWSRIEPLVREYQAMIAEDMRTDTRKLDSFEAFQQSAEALKTFVDRRRAVLLNAPQR